MEDSYIEPSSKTKDSIEPARIDRKNCDLRSGSSCPKCDQGILDYNGLLNLVCLNCDFE